MLSGYCGIIVVIGCWDDKLGGRFEGVERMEWKVAGLGSWLDRRLSVFRPVFAVGLMAATPWGARKQPTGKYGEAHGGKTYHCPSPSLSRRRRPTPSMRLCQPATQLALGLQGTN